MRAFLRSGSGGTPAQIKAYGVLNQTLQQQVGLLAYMDNLRLLALICLVLVPIILLFKKGKGSAPASMSAH